MKPQFILRDFFSVNDRLSIVNTVYSSIGFGGGTSLYSYDDPIVNDNHQINWDKIYYNNRWIEFAGNLYPNVDPTYSSFN